MDEKLQGIQTGDQVFIDDRSEKFGAVRGVAPGGRNEIIVYIQNGGNFEVPVQAIRSVHDAKVILDSSQLQGPIRNAIVYAQEGMPR
jgi:hypothetical protein